MNRLPCSVCREACGNGLATSRGIALRASPCWLLCQTSVWRQNRVCKSHPKHAFRGRKEMNCRRKNDQASVVAFSNYTRKGPRASLSVLVE